METVQTDKRESALFRAIDVSIVIVHLAVVALVVDWLLVSSFNMNLLGMMIVSLPFLAVIVWATVKLWSLSGRYGTDQPLD